MYRAPGNLSSRRLYFSRGTPLTMYHDCPEICGFANLSVYNTPASCPGTHLCTNAKSIQRALSSVRVISRRTRSSCTISFPLSSFFPAVFPPGARISYVGKHRNDADLPPRFANGNLLASDTGGTLIGFSIRYSRGDTRRYINPIRMFY